jgi:hypothetical protein
MIKMLTAYTKEADFQDEALNEIFAQLDIENNLLKNAVGIIHCGYEFIESGIVGLLCEGLPFEVVGATTLALAARGEYGSGILRVSVLTSDDVSFSVALSETLTQDNTDAPLGDAYRRAAVPGEKPALVLAQLPLNLSIGVSQMLDGITAVCGGVPVFGALACDETPDYHESRVIFNGAAFSDEAALLLIYGDIKPRFFVENIGDSENIQEQHGIITEADGCVLKKVNDMVFLDYISEIGLSPEIMRTVKAFPVPFKVNYNEGTKSLIRVLFSITPEGYAVFASEMPVGGSLSLQRLDYGNVVKTAESMANTLASLRGFSGAILYSCVGRNLMLGLKSNDEMCEIAKKLDADAPYLFCYAGAEICPLEDEAGALVNHSHNYSLIACVF